MSKEYRNTSGIVPLGRAVLIRPYEPEIASSVIHIPATVKERTSMIEQRAIVVAVGPEAWRDEASPRAKPGDKVFVSKYAGWLAQGTADGEVYRMVNANDIFAAIVEERVPAALNAHLPSYELPAEAA